MDYFHTPPSLISGDRLSIAGEEFAHLTHVMRKKAGDSIRVVDGMGNAYDVTIKRIVGLAAHCEVLAHHKLLNEPDTRVTLAVALLKNASKFDFLVEKTTELGISSIVPLLTERTIPRHARVERWEKLALAAMKQSGRCIVPRIHLLTSFRDFLSTNTSGDLRMVAHEQVRTPTLHDIVSGREFHSAIVCVGPEGGFTDEEVNIAVEAGFDPISLGKRRLRTETAAIVVTGMILTG